VGYDGPNRFSLRGSNWLPGRKTPPNPGCASKGDFFTHRRKFAPRGVRTPDLWCATGVLRPADLASFARNHASKNRDFSYHFFATNLDCLDGFFRGFGSNYLNGSLPSELGNLAKLEQLYIDSAGLSGPLPSSFSRLTRMKILWASDNDFTGQIPDYIGSWTNLTELRFQGNSFQGPLPTTLSNLVQLTNLRIGDIVNGSSSLAFISNMTSLNTLVLRNCRISDSLASVNFSQFAKLNLLDLSFNNITGQVPQSLLNLNSLSFLFLGNNSLSGSLPSSIGSSLKNLDFSYNQLSGNFPSWASQTSQMNLVANNFVINNNNNSVLPSGLECLQRDTPCFLGSPQSSSFAVDCGSRRSISGSDNSIYQPDNANLGPASYYVTEAPTWGVSNVGRFMDSQNGSYIIYSSRQFQNTLDSELFQTARMSPSSLRYYGIGLDNGNYTVTLQFAEFDFEDMQTWKSLGKRVFDIYVQVGSTVPVMLITYTLVFSL